MTASASNIDKSKRYRFISTGICFFLALLAFFAPVWPGTSIVPHLGALLLWAAVFEIYHGFRRATSASRSAAWTGGAYSLVMAVILMNAESLQRSALYTFITIAFALDGVRHFFVYLKRKRSGERSIFHLISACSNLLVVAALFLFKQKGQEWILSLVIAFRMVNIGLTMLRAKEGLLGEVSEDVVADMNLGDNPEVLEIAQEIEEEEESSAPYAKKTNNVFIIVLFFIHLGRMGFDRSFLGILSPLVATIGDMVIALVISYAIVGPIRFALKKSYGWTEDNLWLWVLQVKKKERKLFSVRGFTERLLKNRIRSSIRFRKAGYSLATAFRTGLNMGLPYSALLAAIMPVLGMSWYFDTENWASGMWDRWAATRADNWRMAMTSSMGEGTTASAFRLQPEGVTDTSDFSFVVIGDPGEGDASQLVLKDQFLAVSNKPDVKFVVISSDVVYPSGSIKDYERKFWMPFKGVSKPVYAIPGNHDWYDALDGFVATFYKPEAAKTAMAARVRQDLMISSTTSRKIDEMISKSAEWRNVYGVPAGHQTAPYFQVSTKDFVLITIETGVERQIDSLQLDWVKNVLEASRGKFVMVLLGHPFYAIGEYQGVMNPKFDSLHSLLRSYNVPLVMAGDTHDLEYYKETPDSTSEKVTHNFVNGGGGAYLSIGMAMAKPDVIPTRDYAFYPSYAPLAKKIENNTSWYKYPAWWWTRKAKGWPFSAEWLSAMFDYNISPFFQSFLEIRVERSKKQIRLIPYSNNGRLKWSDFTSTPGARPSGAENGDWAEWTIGME